MHIRPARFALAVISVLLVSIAAEAGEESVPSAPAPAEPPLAAADPGSDEPRLSGRVLPSTRRAKRLVYACREHGSPVFSDRPCGMELDARPIDVSLPSAGEVPSTRPPRPVAATRPIAVRVPPQPRVDAEPPDRCARLDAQLAAIDERMRQGYSAREAAKLWQRWRDAKAKLRAARC